MASAYVEIPHEFIDFVLPRISGENLRVLVLCLRYLKEFDQASVLEMGIYIRRHRITEESVNRLIQDDVMQGLTMHGITKNRLSKVRSVRRVLKRMRELLEEA